MNKKNKNLLYELELEAKSYFDRYSKKINRAHGWDHVMRVRKNCEKILIYENTANEMEVYIAALLHDIGRFKDDEGEHAEWSYIEAKKLLKKYNGKFNDEIDFNKILNIIRYHSLKDEDVPNNIVGILEFKILVDADRIDSFGPIGILRAPLDSSRFKTIEDQICHIKDKSKYEEYKLNSNGGQKVGEQQKKYLYIFIEDYNKQLFSHKENFKNKSRW